MDELGKNEIVYEEGWRDAAPKPIPETSPPECAAEPQLDSEQRKASGLMLITVQLVICILLAVLVLVLKTADSGAFHSFADYFRDELKKPVISQGVFSSIDESLFKNQAKASADEAQAR